MLQQNITHIELADLTAERQTNYLILRTLESKLEPHTFRNLINSVSKFSLNFVRSVTRWTYLVTLHGTDMSYLAATMS